MRRLSIHNILILTISALSLMIALLAAKEVYINWQQLIKMQSLKQAMVISDKLFDATEKISIERDIAYTILHARNNETIEDLKPQLEESWSEADHAFDSAMQALQQYHFAEIEQLRQKIELQLSSIQELRKEINQALALADDPQKKVLSDRWFKESTTIIVQIQDLWMEFSKHFTNIHPVVTQHLRYKYFLRIISDYTGRERSIIGRLIVENSEPTPEEFAQLLRGQGIIDLSWKFATTLSKQTALFDPIASEANDAISHYQTLQDMVRDIFYIAPGTRKSVSYPIGVDLWFEISAQAKESFTALRDASLREIQNYVDMLELKTQQTIGIHLGVLFFTLLLCLYSFWVIIMRVIGPINAMVGALVNATQGKPSHMPRVINPDDEIGKLAQVLQAFHENRDRIRLIIDHALDAIVTMDQEGKITEWNGQAEIIFGWKREEVLGKALDALIIPPSYREKHRQGMQRFLSDGTGPILDKRIELIALNQRGVIFPVELAVTAQKLYGSYSFTAFIRDITTVKEAETKLLSYTHALERSNKELDDFAYIASHDLKEPLRGLFNHATFLLEDYKDKLDEDGVRKLHRLSYLAQRMERLVNDLLYFSRLGRQELAIQPTDMNEVIHDIESMLDVFLEERQGRIVIPRKLPTVTCDKTRITEVFRNLITNAIKYSDKPEKIVEIGFKENFPLPDGKGFKEVFYVKDNGKGIPPEFSDEIFRIFKRLQSSKDSAEEGTGVGLTFVKKIIERHGGEIWLESEVGKGTTFYFTLGL
jgi:PAS domain S-box-containing protein